MTQRKKYVIDKMFQLKTAFFDHRSHPGGVGGYRRARSAQREHEQPAPEHNIIVLYNNNVEALLAFSQEAEGAENLPIANVSRIHAENVRTMERIIAQNNALFVGASWCSSWARPPYSSSPSSARRTTSPGRST
jgi:hypothetical protein